MYGNIVWAQRQIKLYLVLQNKGKNNTHVYDNKIMLQKAISRISLILHKATQARSEKYLNEQMTRQDEIRKASLLKNEAEDGQK